MSKAQHTKKQGAAQEASPARAKRKLTRAEKKQIAALIQKAKGEGKAHTAQQTIPYLQMYPDGICRVSAKKYSKSMEYDDINYQLAQADDKTAIFENWCDFLNYFDASVSVQLSFINQGTQQEKAQKAIDIAPQDDAFNSIRTEYADMLKNQLAKGNNGLEKHKYITFSIEADNLNAAKARLARIETDILNNFKVLGVSARPMTGYDHLQTLHGVFHPEGEPFTFDWAYHKGLYRPVLFSLWRGAHVPHGAQNRRGIVLTDTCPGAERPYPLSLRSLSLAARRACSPWKRPSLTEP